MPNLAGGTGERDVAHLEQLLQSATMKLLNEEIFICEWPESPDLVKHHNQVPTAAFFPLDESANQISRITKSIVTISAVLHEHLSIVGRKLSENFRVGFRERCDFCNRIGANRTDVC